MPTILFDLDGTLVDHFEAIYNAYRKTQEALGLEPASFETVKRTVGGSLPVTMRRLLGDAFTEEAIVHFNTIIREEYTLGLRLLPGARELLEHLAAQPDHQLAVFTNKQHHLSRKVCEHLGIDAFFDAIEGSERPEGFRKPNRDFSEHILRLLHTTPDQTTLIGDSPFDFQAARVVGIQYTYLVATGSHSREELAEQTDAKAIFTDMIELAAAVFNFNLGTRS